MQRKWTNRKWGVIDQNGREVVPPQYEAIRQFAANGLAVTKKDGKWGYIDQNGQEAIPLQYESALSFAENGLAVVKEKAIWLVINQTGKILLRIEPADKMFILRDGHGKQIWP